MQNFKMNFRFSVIILLIVLAAFSRIIPHPPNFAPIDAMALFGTAYFSKKYLALLIPVLSMWISDLFLNNVIYGQYFEGFTWFYPGFYYTYGAFIVIGMIGFLLLKGMKIHNILLSSIFASLIFFIISNFGVWVTGNMYPKSFTGLIACYAAGIPFFKNTLLGDLFYCGVLFGLFEFIQFLIPSIRIKPLKM